MLYILKQWTYNSPGQIIQMNTDCHALEDIHNHGNTFLPTANVKCHSGEKIFTNGKIIMETINHIDSLAIDANEGLLYFTKGESLYVFKDGQQIKIHEAEYNIFPIVTGGKYFVKYFGECYIILYN